MQRALDYLIQISYECKAAAERDFIFISDCILEVLWLGQGRSSSWDSFGMR
jgi:hypothetical protein